uniref:Secreted protein n=1 Tax=Arundo donax TaxID=35708 RepID=A0A0A9CXW4_ARUDO
MAPASAMQIRLFAFLFARRRSSAAADLCSSGSAEHNLDRRASMLARSLEEHADVGLLGCDERLGASIPLASHHWAIRLLRT